MDFHFRNLKIDQYLTVMLTLHLFAFCQNTASPVSPLGLACKETSGPVIHLSVLNCSGTSVESHSGVMKLIGQVFLMTLVCY